MVDILKFEDTQWEEQERMIPLQVKQIRSVMQDKYGIEIPRSCDQFIERCLRLKDGKMDKAVKLIKTFHTVTVDFLDWDATLLPSIYSEFYQTGLITPLLKRDSHGRRIYIIRADLWDPLKMNFDEALAFIWMTAQYINAEFVDVQRHGIVTIWDFSNFSLQQAWAVKQLRILTLAKWVQNSVAGRISAFHIIFHPRIVGVIYTGIKPFLKEKLRKRIIFHGDSLESLHKHVDPMCLPTRYGGVFPDKSDEYFDKQMVTDVVKKDEYFKEMMSNRLPSK